MVKKISLFLVITATYLITFTSTSVENLDISEKIDQKHVNKFEEIILQVGVNMVITSSWQLLVGLFSKENCEICVSNPINEFVETNDQIKKKLNKPWLFHLHPSKNITSKILVRPKPDFLNFALSQLEIDRSLTFAEHSDVPLFLNTTKNLFSCNLMLKELIKKEFIYINVPLGVGNIEERYEPIEKRNSNLYEDIDKYKYHEMKKKKLNNAIVNNFCMIFLVKLSKLIHKIGMIRAHKVRHYRKKIIMYNRICNILDNDS